VTLAAVCVVAVGAILLTGGGNEAATESPAVALAAQAPASPAAEEPPRALASADVPSDDAAALADSGRTETPDESPAVPPDVVARRVTEAVDSLLEAITGSGPSAPADPPLEPEFAPDPARKRIDIPRSLRQPIVRYELPRGKPLADWLPELADLVGAPIRFDAAELGNSAIGLKAPVQLRLENTTVGDILADLLRIGGLAYRVETDHIRIVPH
jgi:hypothetical protein